MAVRLCVRRLLQLLRGWSPFVPRLVRLWCALLHGAGDALPGGCHSGMGAPAPESIRIEGMFAWIFSVRRAAPSEPRRNTSNQIWSPREVEIKAEIFFHLYFHSWVIPEGGGKKRGNIFPLRTRPSSITKQVVAF
jgi:hypothetical protein